MDDSSFEINKESPIVNIQSDESSRHIQGQLVKDYNILRQKLFKSIQEHSETLVQSQTKFEELKETGEQYAQNIINSTNDIQEFLEKTVKSKIQDCADLLNQLQNQWESWAKREKLKVDRISDVLQQEVTEENQLIEAVNQMEKLKQLNLIKKTFDFQPNVHIKFDQVIKKIQKLFEFKLEQKQVKDKKRLQVETELNPSKAQTLQSTRSHYTAQNTKRSSIKTVLSPRLKHEKIIRFANIADKPGFSPSSKFTDFFSFQANQDC